MPLNSATGQLQHEHAIAVEPKRSAIHEIMSLVYILSLRDNGRAFANLSFSRTRPLTSGVKSSNALQRELVAAAAGCSN
jgi:hypothetical protein